MSCLDVCSCAQLVGSGWNQLSSSTVRVISAGAMSLLDAATWNVCNTKQLYVCLLVSHADSLDSYQIIPVSPAGKLLADIKAYAALPHTSRMTYA